MPRTKPSLPTEVLKTHGTFRKHLHGNRMDIDLQTLPTNSPIPPPPEGLHKEAAAQWGRKIEELLLKRILTPIDFSNLKIIFGHLSQALYFYDQLVALGFPEKPTREDIETRKGINKSFQESTQTYTKLGYDYGFSPTARAALRVPPEPEKDLDPLEVVIGN